MNTEKETVEALLSLLVSLVSHIQKNFPGKDVGPLKSSINILRQQDERAYSKIRKHITNALRPIYENRTDTDEFNLIADAIYEIIDKNPVFRKEQ